MFKQATGLNKLNYSINETSTLSGVCRTKLYEEIGAGRLKILKCGRRTLVPADSIREWLNLLAQQS